MVVAGGTVAYRRKLRHLVRLVATAEQCSDHPLARAVLEYARQRQISIPALPSSAFENHPGIGVSCHYDGNVISVGNRILMERAGRALNPKIESAMWDLEIQRKTAVCVSYGSALIGIIGISDALKLDAAFTVQSLRSQGIDVWIATGDHRTTAEIVADEVGVSRDRLLSGALPADKVAKIRELQSQGRVVAMIGDGINDSPALVQADFGIAVGRGSHIAVEAGDMILVRNNLFDVVVAIDLAKIVFRRVKWNLLWAVLYNIIAIPVAAGVCYPWTHMAVPPQYAGLSMAMSSMSVILSSLSLRWYKKPKLYSRENGNGSRGLLRKAIR